MKLDGVFLRSLGIHLPPRMAAERAVELGLYEEEEFLDSGITGALVSDDVSVPDMAVLAARHAIERSGEPAAEVDYLVHAGGLWQGPEMWSPAGYFLRELGCGNIPALEIRQGCNGLLAGIEVAAGRFAVTDDCRTALITASGTANSPIVDRWRGGGPGVVLSDGASALMLSKRGGFAEVRAVNSMFVAELEGMHRGRESLFEPAVRRPIEATAMMLDFAEASNRPFADTSALIAKSQLEVINASLDEAGVTAPELARVIYVNLARHVVEYMVMRPLGLPLDRSCWDFGRQYGHLGASDQVVSLDHLLTTGQVGPGDHILLTGGAPGYAVTSAVITVVDRPSWLTD